MATAYISHPECQRHDTGPGHPECARRLTAIEDRFLARGLFDVLRHIDAPMVTTEQLLRVHTREHLATIAAMLPTEGYARLDPDTVISAGSLTAAHRAAGALVAAVDLVMSGDMDSAFCCVRPPGHHAERNLATGFCLFNNIAVGAAHAFAEHGVNRIAIVDFDVHHGNGTEDIFRDNQQVLFCSTFQHPFYPFTPLLEDAPNRVSVPLDAKAKSAEFRAAVIDRWLPALESFAPELVLVSAGFDAHEADDMSNVSLTDADFDWVTERIVDIAARHASGRVISTLEGGYDFDSLTRCVEQHVRIIMGLR